MASITTYKVKNGRNERERTRFRVRFRTAEGKQTDKRGFKTRADAERFRANVEVSLDRNEYVSPTSSRITLGELAGTWLRRKKSVLKTSAYESLESAWRVHVAPQWENKALNRISKGAVEQWIADLLEGTTVTGRAPVGASVVIRCHEVLAGILDDAVSQNRLVSNPARGVQLPKKGRKPHVYLTHDQVFALAESSGRAGLVLTLAYTGIRWGEATGLQVKHVDLFRKRLQVERNLVNLKYGGVDETKPKNGKARSVPFPAFLEPYLREATKNKLPNAHLFTEPDGGMLRRPHTVTGWFDAAVREVGCQVITPHDLRHTAASFAVSSGANVKAVQRMLGHSSAAMTLDVYADLFDDDLDAVATALDTAVQRARGVSSIS
ncbi:site-specific integrase [Microbacterium foliorum]|uniref:tyrosine-type recombinase/integrase n=1 Tax=Rothia terrae TaxID=396015 RepID=UPI003414FF6B